MQTEPVEFHLPSVSSTSDYAKELLGTNSYVFVSAQHQTAGRGRNGRTWIGDAYANAYCSFGIRHQSRLTIEDLSAYMARGALSVLDVLKAIAPNCCFRLKYPNDVQAHTQNGWSKIAGVLVEHEFQGQSCTTTVVGIGLNVGQKQFPENINQLGTSLTLLGLSSDVDTVLLLLRDAFQRWRAKSWTEVHNVWVDTLAMSNRRLRLADAEGWWLVLRVLTDGRLVVQEEVSHIERTISDGDTLRYKD